MRNADQGQGSQWPKGLFYANEAGSALPKSGTTGSSRHLPCGKQALCILLLLLLLFLCFDFETNSLCACPRQLHRPGWSSQSWLPLPLEDWDMACPAFAQQWKCLQGHTLVSSSCVNLPRDCPCLLAVISSRRSTRATVSNPRCSYGTTLNTPGLLCCTL